jgi:hypothetical protein
VGIVALARKLLIEPWRSLQHGVAGSDSGVYARLELSTDFFVFNGLNGASGEYLLAPTPVQELSKIAQGE